MTLYGGEFSTFNLLEYSDRFTANVQVFNELNVFFRWVVGRWEGDEKKSERGRGGERKTCVFPRWVFDISDGVNIYFFFRHSPPEFHK